MVLIIVIKSFNMMLTVAIIDQHWQTLNMMLIIVIKSLNIILIIVIRSLNMMLIIAINK